MANLKIMLGAAALAGWVGITAIAGGLKGPGAVQIIAHRGASHDAPENTLAAFKLGWEQKADAVELDIWRTGDGKIVVIHDEKTKRTTGVEKNVSHSTLAELRELDAGLWKGAQWAGQKLPTLEEALALIPAGRKLVIEIKCGPQVLGELERVIKGWGRMAGELLIISFKYDVCEQARKRFAEIPVLWLASFKQDKETGVWSPGVDELISKTKAAGLKGLNVSYKGPVDGAFIKKVKDAGFACYVWTVNDAAEARRLVAAGVDGITTDRPGWMREQLQMSGAER